VGENTKIAWTNHSHNPWIGCQEVTEEECGDCYAKRWAHQHQLTVWGPLLKTPRKLTKTWDNPFKWNRQAERENRRIKVFCASLADVFEPHPDVVDARHHLWETIEQTPHLDWQLLTKRPKFIRRLVPQSWLQNWPAHVWIGTSVGMQDAADKRIHYVIDLPAPVIFLSCEPLVQHVLLASWLEKRKITWVICGGYSGTRNWPMDLEWARSLRDECRTYGVAFFMKQLGTVYAKQHGLADWKGGNMEEFPEDLRIREFPASSARAA
jgi:protein gp37